MRGGILRRFRLRAACLLAAASLSLSPPIVSWAQQSSDQQAAPAPGADYSRIEIDAKLSAREASSIARLDVLAQRVANAESRLADAREYLDRLLLIFLVSIVLVLFLFANNLRLHHRGATQRILRISREAEIALGGLKREMANPEMENMRTAQALRTMMRRLREGSLSALPPNLAAQVEAAAAHPHLPVMVHLMAVALLSEQRADWRGARAHLARLHEMDERDADVLLHLSHVHRRLAEKFGDENDMKMSYRYYTRFAMNEGRSDPQFELPPPPAATVAATETEPTIAIEAKKEAATAAATPAPAAPATPAVSVAAEIPAPISDSPRPPETRAPAAASNGGAPPPAQSAPPLANQPRPLVPPPQWKTAPPAVEKAPPPAPPSAPLAAKPQPQSEPPPVAKAPPPAPAVVKAQPQIESPPPAPPPPPLQSVAPSAKKPDLIASPVAKTPPPASLAAKLQLQNKPPAPPAPPPIAAKPQPQNTPPPQAASDKGWRLSKMFRRTPKEESKIVAPVAPVAPQAPQAKVSPVVAQNAAPQPRPQEPPLRPPLPPNPDSPPSRPKPPPPKPSIAAPPHPSLPHIPTAMPPVGAPPPKPPVAAMSAGKETPAPPPPKIETPPKSALLGKLASVAAQAKSRPAPPPSKVAVAPAPPESPKPAPKAATKPAPQPPTKPTQPVAAPTVAPPKAAESPPRQSNGKADGGIKKRFLAGINGFGFAKKPALQLPSIPADVSDAERKMWIEIRAAEEWAHKSRAAKTRSRRGKLMDKALARYEAAQNHKTSRKLYYDWGVAYVGRALIEPEEKRSYFLAAAADKFIAGNVNAPHAFDFHLASIYALMKDDKKCEHWLSQAAEHGGLDAAALSADPEFETMRGKDWFRRFLA